MTKALLVALTILFFIPNLLNITIYPESRYDNKEEYDMSLSDLHSVSRLDGYIDSLLVSKKIKNTTYECVKEISDVIRKRFYHGYSHFALNENWIAAVGGKLIDSGMACKVEPDNILSHANAACSQQAIVMMALLRKKGFSYRHIGFPHHYALEVLIKDTWYFFDPNMEPNMSKEQRSSKEWRYQSDCLKQYYVKQQAGMMNYAFGDGLTAQRGIINEIPAPNARIFQATTGILSKTLWCFPLFLLLIRSGKKNTPEEII